MPNKLDMEKAMKSTSMGLCSVYFRDCKTFKQLGKYKLPEEPPKYFPNVPQSTVGTPQPQSRSTVRCTAESHRINDQDFLLKKFMKEDMLFLKDFKPKFETALKHS